MATRTLNLITHPINWKHFSLLEVIVLSWNLVHWIRRSCLIQISLKNLKWRHLIPRGPTEQFMAKQYISVTYVGYIHDKCLSRNSLPNNAYQVIPGNLQKYVSTNRSPLQCKTLLVHFSNNMMLYCLLNVI